MDKKPRSEGISSHFKTEAIFMASIFLIMVIVSLIAGLFGPQIMRRIDINRCQKAGGTFDSETRQCQLAKPEMKQNHRAQ